MVVLHQSLSGDMGPEHLPADASSLWRLRHMRPLPARGSDEDRKVAQRGVRPLGGGRAQGATERMMVYHPASSAFGIVPAPGMTALNR